MKRKYTFSLLTYRTKVNFEKERNNDSNRCNNDRYCKVLFSLLQSIIVLGITVLQIIYITDKGEREFCKKFTMFILNLSFFITEYLLNASL